MSNDLLGLDFLSSWTHVVAKYIVGMAAAFSGDFNFAAIVFEDLQKQLHPSAGEPPAVARIRGQLPKRLAEVNTLRASRAHHRWVASKSDQHLAEIGKFSDAVPDQFVKQIGAANLKAIWLFLSKRDARSALALIEQNRIEGDLAWLVNRAFLHAYLGNLRRANVFYRKAEGYQTNAEVLRQVDEFLEWLSGQEPDKVEILFCIGMVAWRIRGDLVVAEREFQLFLSRCPQGMYAGERQMVESWLVEIRRALKGDA